MLRIYTLGTITASFGLLCFGQEGDRNRGGEMEIPLPLVSPRAVGPSFIPLTPKEKAALAFRNTFYPRAVANRVLLAGIDELTNTPSAWPGGAEGFGMRLGTRMGALATRQAIELGGDIIFHTDPRYDLCQCTSFWGRTRHAWSRVVRARKDDGGETIAIARLAGD